MTFKEMQQRLTDLEQQNEKLLQELETWKQIAAGGVEGIRLIGNHLLMELPNDPPVPPV